MANFFDELSWEEFHTKTWKKLEETRGYSFSNENDFNRFLMGHLLKCTFDNERSIRLLSFNQIFVKYKVFAGIVNVDEAPKGKTELKTLINILNAIKNNKKLTLIPRDKNEEVSRRYLTIESLIPRGMESIASLQVQSARSELVSRVVGGGSSSGEPEILDDVGASSSSATTATTDATENRVGYALQRIETGNKNSGFNKLVVISAQTPKKGSDDVKIDDISVDSLVSASLNKEETSGYKGYDYLYICTVINGKPVWDFYTGDKIFYWDGKNFVKASEADKDAKSKLDSVELFVCDGNPEKDPAFKISAIYPSVFSLEDAITKDGSKIEESYSAGTAKRIKSENGMPIVTEESDSVALHPVKEYDEVPITDDYIVQDFVRVGERDYIRSHIYQHTAEDEGKNLFIRLSVPGVDYPVMFNLFAEDDGKNNNNFLYIDGKQVRVGKAPLYSLSKLRSEVIGKAIECKLEGETEKRKTAVITAQDFVNVFEDAKTMQPALMESDIMSEHSYIRLANGKFVKEKDYVTAIHYDFVKNPSPAAHFDAWAYVDPETNAVTIIKSKSQLSHYPSDNVFRVKKSTQEVAKSDIIQTTSDLSAKVETGVLLHTPYGKDKKVAKDGEILSLSNVENREEIEKKATSEVQSKIKKGTYHVGEVLVGGKYIQTAPRKGANGTGLLDHARFVESNTMYMEDVASQDPDYKNWKDSKVQIDPATGKVKKGPAFDMKKANKAFFKKSNVQTLTRASFFLFVMLAPLWQISAAMGAIALTAMVGMWVAAPIVNLIRKIIYDRANHKYKKRNEEARKNLKEKVCEDIDNISEAFVKNYGEIPKLVKGEYKDFILDKKRDYILEPLTGKQKDERADLEYNIKAMRELLNGESEDVELTEERLNKMLAENGTIVEEEVVSFADKDDILAVVDKGAKEGKVKIEGLKYDEDGKAKIEGLEDKDIAILSALLKDTDLDRGAVIARETLVQAAIDGRLPENIAAKIIVGESKGKGKESTPITLESLLGRKKETKYRLNLKADAAEKLLRAKGYTEDIKQASDESDKDYRRRLNDLLIDNKFVNINDDGTVDAKTAEEIDPNCQFRAQAQYLEEQLIKQKQTELGVGKIKEELDATTAARDEIKDKIEKAKKELEAAKKSKSKSAKTKAEAKAEEIDALNKQFTELDSEVSKLQAKSNSANAQVTEFSNNLQYQGETVDGKMVPKSAKEKAEVIQGLLIEKRCEEETALYEEAHARQVERLRQLGGAHTSAKFKVSKNVAELTADNADLYTKWQTERAEAQKALKKAQKKIKRAKGAEYTKLEEQIAQLKTKVSSFSDDMTVRSTDIPTDPQKTKLEKMAEAKRIETLVKAGVVKSSDVEVTKPGDSKNLSKAEAKKVENKDKFVVSMADELAKEERPEPKTKLGRLFRKVGDTFRNFGQKIASKFSKKYDAKRKDAEDTDALRQELSTGRVVSGYSGYSVAGRKIIATVAGTPPTERDKSDTVVGEELVDEEETKPKPGSKKKEKTPEEIEAEKRAKEARDKMTENHIRITNAVVLEKLEGLSDDELRKLGEKYRKGKLPLDISVIKQYIKDLREKVKAENNPDIKLRVKPTATTSRHNCYNIYVALGAEYADEVAKRLGVVDPDTDGVKF